MLFLIILNGILINFYGIPFLMGFLVFTGSDLLILSLFFGIPLMFHIAAFVALMIVYCHPRYRRMVKKRKQRRKEKRIIRQAAKEESDRQKKELQSERRLAREALAMEKKRRAAELQRQWREDYLRRTTVVSTRLLGEGAAEYKKSVGSMAVRGAIGSVFGPAGTVIGMATAKNKNVNKNVRRFLVKYQDGHIAEKEATKGSALYKEYMAHLEWGDNSNGEW